MADRIGPWEAEAMRREPRRAAGALVLILFLITLDTSWSARAGESAATLPELVLLAPGTAVGEKLPRGWSDLVIKSIPRLDSGDLDTLPTFAQSTASLFHTVIVADVRPAKGQGPPFRLARVGLGVCVPVVGLDTVVDQSNATSSKMARTDRFAVLATPTEMKVGASHRHVLLFYAFLVEPETGRLRTSLWAVMAAPKDRVPPKTLTVLAPRLVYRCNLDVEAQRLLGTLPVNWNFAMRALPPGERMAVPDELKPWLVDPHRIEADPAGFERRVRAIFRGD
jgi:hypothetical protein